MAYPDAIIYACTERGLEQVIYDETHQVWIMRQFMANPKRMLTMLLSDDD